MVGIRRALGVDEMTEPTAPSNSVDALFGVDGTQLPDPLPVLADPLTGPEQATWRTPPTVPPAPLLPALDVGAMHEAINAVFGEGLAAPVVRPTAAIPVNAPRSGAAAQARPVGAVLRPRVPHPVEPPPARAGRPVPRRPLIPTPARAIPPADLRRRINRDLLGARRQTRSAVGTRPGCVIGLFIFGVVAVNVVAGIVRSLSALIH